MTRSYIAPGLSGISRAEYLPGSTVSRPIGLELDLARNSLNHRLFVSSNPTNSTLFPYKGYNSHEITKKNRESVYLMIFEDI